MLSFYAFEQVFSVFIRKTGNLRFPQVCSAQQDQITPTMVYDVVQEFLINLKGSVGLWIRHNVDSSPDRFDSLVIQGL
jgi:hypothetical protein